MKRKIRILALVALVSVLLCGCCLSHDWQEATCTVPKTCAKCQEVEGEALGHDWTPATCQVPETCTACGLTQGEPLAHSWQEATCTTPVSCQACAATQGEPLGHSWVRANCIVPQYCSVCDFIVKGVGNHIIYKGKLTESQVDGQTFVIQKGYCEMCGHSEATNQYKSWEEAGCHMVLGKRLGYGVSTGGLKLERFVNTEENYVELCEDGTATFVIFGEERTGTWTYQGHEFFINSIGHEINQMLIRIDLSNGQSLDCWVNDIRAESLAFRLNDLTYMYFYPDKLPPVKEP